MDIQPSEEIKSRLDIADVISSYIKLQRSGSSLKAVCPFHNENTPSFFVSPEKQIFNCFGCGEGGDMFKFVMKMEGVEFVDALRILAKRAGVELKREDPKTSSEKSVLQDICVNSARFFYKILHDEPGKKALSYLKERGLSDEIIDEFKIGYISDSWDGLYNFLSMKGFKPDMIEKAGLILKSTKSNKLKYFDRFRGRIMFPISDANGYISGFTGRYLEKKEKEGKYINSPETPIFNKSRILYNLDKAKVDIKKEGFVLLVEGQMDVIMSWQDGIKNVVASSGTALTPEQAKLLKRYTNNIKVAFDMDVAGDMATKKGIDILQEAGFNVSVARVPDGKDPADFVLSHPGKLKEILEGSIPVMDFYFESALSKYDPKKLEDKKKIAEDILPHIKSLSNKIDEYYWLEKLAEILGLEIKYLEVELDRVKLDDSSYRSVNAESFSQKEEDFTKSDKVMHSLMSILLKNGKKLNVLEESGFLKFWEEERKELENIMGKKTANLFDFFIECANIGQVSDILVKANEQERDVLNPIAMKSEFLDENFDFDSEIYFCLKSIKDDFFKNQVEVKNREIKAAEDGGDEKELLNKIQELNKIINSKDLWQFQKKESKKQ